VEVIGSNPIAPTITYELSTSSDSRSCSRLAVLSERTGLFSTLSLKFVGFEAVGVVSQHVQVRPAQHDSDDGTIATQHELDILCSYFRSDFATEEDISTLERVCAEHSAVYRRELC